MPPEGDDKNDKGNGGSGGDGGEKTVSYARFQEVVQQRNELKTKVGTIEKEAQTNAERAATADTLASQLKDLQAARKKETADWEEERGLLRAGFTDPDAIDVARVLHGKLPEKDRPTLGDWLDNHKKNPDKAPKALSPWLSAPPEGDKAGDKAGDKKTSDKGGKGNADTRGGQRSDGQQRAGEPLTAEKITEIRERALASGNWDEWKKVREQAYASE